MSTNETPMIRQYLSIKEQYPDAILFYRMGDFYEMFFTDAEIASRILEITLTSRNKNKEKSIPMCGVPFRAAQNYIAKLLEAGKKVAICDQVEDPAKAKGIVKREVVRVVTPGMIVENEFLDARTDNFVLAAAMNRKKIGIAYLDISTGGFRVTESEDADALAEEILRVSPSEWIFPESAAADPRFAPLIQTATGKALTYLPDARFGYDEGRERLTEQFRTLFLEGFGCEDLHGAVGAAGAVLFYVGETQKQKIDHLAGIETYHLTDYLIIDEAGCRNLELTGNLRTGARQGSLIEVIDKTVTAMGGRLLRRWLRYPLIHKERIDARLEAVGEAVAQMSVTREAREVLKSVYDLERLNSRILMGHANARDLTALKNSLLALPDIAAIVGTLDSPLYQWTEDLTPLNLLADLIDRAVREDAPPTISEGGIIRTGFNPELDELIQLSKDGKGWLAKLEAKEKELTGISSLKVRFNKVFGYYLEVPKAHSEKVPERFIRKQTLVNAERYITEELKDFETRVLNAEERRAALEYEIFNDIREEVRKSHEAVRDAARFIARLDGLLNLAHTADENRYCLPEIVSDGRLEITDARHPVIEKMIAAERFVPNTIRLDNRENQVLIITGPNMAGKSTVLRQAALITIMAQMGSFVPAERAVISLTDRIFTRVGALDNLSQGQSTFMVEMQETANILNNATPDSLVILDEIGRGTSTYDGLSIAWAVAEYLHDLKGKGVRTLFATHYHELIELADTHPRIRNYHIAVREEDGRIIFLRKLAEGGTSRSYGIEVARLAGIPGRVIARAGKVLSKVENHAPAFNGESANRKKSAKKAGPTTVVREDGAAPHVQLELFSPGRFLVEQLNKIDVAAMTPIDALNYLSELQERARSR